MSRGKSRDSITLGQVAQLVEQQTENLRVGGSIPSLATAVRQSLHFRISEMQALSFSSKALRIVVYRRAAFSSEIARFARRNDIACRLT